jgi:hypothetical protein
MPRTNIFLPFSGGSVSERLLRDRGRLRHALTVYQVGKLNRALDFFLRDEWRPPANRYISDYRISLTSWRPRLTELPLVLLTLLQQTLRPKEVIVWLTTDDHHALSEHIRGRFGEFGVRFQTCDDLKPHKKWLPMIEEGQDTPFVICDDDIIYPKEWFAALVAEDRPDAYVGAKCHFITVDSKKTVASYSAWKKQIRPGGSPSHRVFITGCGGAVIHPTRIPKKFLNREELFKQCPNGDDIWLKAAHLAAGVPCYKTRYCFPCLELPGSNESGLAVSNVDNGGNDAQIQNLQPYFSLISQQFV